MDQITVTFNESQAQIVIGGTVKDALIALGLEGELSTEYQENPYVCSLVNNEVRCFSDRLICNSALVPQRLFSDLGKRSYRQSICFLLSAAVDALYPNRRLIIDYALGDGYYFTFNDRYLLSKQTLSEIIEKMNEFQKANLPIERVLLPYQDALSYFEQKKFDQTIDLLTTNNNPTVGLFEMAGFKDTSYEPLVPQSGLLSVWELRVYNQTGLLLRYPRSFNFTQLDTYRDNPLLFKALQKNKEQSPVIQVKSVGELSKLSMNSTISSFIRLSEEYQAKNIADIADSICSSQSTKFVIIAGPSSSGKTTFAFKLCLQLQVRGKKTIKISLDDYFLPPDQAPKDSNGKPDLECLEALNLPLLQNNFQDLLEGKAVALPRFDFKTHSTFERPLVQLDNQTILVIEGIHGMNPQLYNNLENDSLFKIYISALTQVNIDNHNRISTTDNRIIRRIVRDYRTRGSSAEKTLSMLPSILRGENLYIFPYQNNADVMINSALDYELAVLSPLAQPLLRMVRPSPDMVYATARRLLQFLNNFQPIEDTLVPPDSLLREFIGGSEYNVI